MTTTKHTPAPWSTMARSQRSIVGRYECDVWRNGSGAMYSVRDSITGCYVKSGRCLSLDWAKEVSGNFAVSLLAELDKVQS